jgi:hypothetical protein
LLAIEAGVLLMHTMKGMAPTAALMVTVTTTTTTTKPEDNNTRDLAIRFVP